MSGRNSDRNGNRTTGRKGIRKGIILALIVALAIIGLIGCSNKINETKIYEQFLADEIEVYDQYGNAHKFSELKETDEVLVNEEYKYADVDNDKKLELTLWTPFYGGYFIDEKDGKLCVFAQGDGTAMVLDYLYHESADRKDKEVWLVYSDVTHVGRAMRHFFKYNGDGQIVDEFELNAEYWESETDQYDENSLFTYRGEKISMAEFEKILGEFSL